MPVLDADKLSLPFTAIGELKLNPASVETDAKMAFGLNSVEPERFGKSCPDGTVPIEFQATYTAFGLPLAGSTSVSRAVYAPSVYSGRLLSTATVGLYAGSRLLPHRYNTCWVVEKLLRTRLAADTIGRVPGPDVLKL